MLLLLLLLCVVRVLAPEPTKTDSMPDFARARALARSSIDFCSETRYQPTNISATDGSHCLPRLPFAASTQEHPFATHAHTTDTILGERHFTLRAFPKPKNGIRFGLGKRSTPDIATCSSSLYSLQSTLPPLHPFWVV